MVKPIWILLKQETVSGSGIRWAICNSALSSRQDNHASTPPLSFLQAGCPSCCPTNSIKALNGHSIHELQTQNAVKMLSLHHIHTHASQRLSFLDCLTGQCNITVFMTSPNNEPMHTCSRVNSGQVGQFLSSEFKILFKNFH